MTKFKKRYLFNALIIAIPVILGLSLIWFSDEDNRFWQGRAIGGAIAIVIILILCFSVIAISAYKNTKSKQKTLKTLKDALKSLLSSDNGSSSRKKK